LDSFLKVLRNSDDTFEAVFPDGHRYYFSNTGTIEKEQDGFTNRVEYRWSEDNLLSEVQINDSEPVAFHYQPCDLKSVKNKSVKLPFWHRGRRHASDQCLSEVRYDDHAPLVVQYSDQLYLSQVAWKDSRFKLFSATYGPLRETLDNTKSVNTCEGHSVPGKLEDPVLLTSSRGEQRMVERQTVLSWQQRESRFASNTKDDDRYGEARSAYAFFGDFNGDQVTDYFYQSQLLHDKQELLIRRGAWEKAMPLVYFGSPQGSFDLRGSQSPLPAAYNTSSVKSGDITTIMINGDHKGIVKIGDFNGDGISDILLNEAIRDSIAKQDIYSLRIAFGSPKGFVEKELSFDSINPEVSQEKSHSIGLPLKELKFAAYEYGKKAKPQTTHFPWPNLKTLVLDINKDGMSDIITFHNVYIATGRGFEVHSHSDLDGIGVWENSLAQSLFTDNKKGSLFDNDEDGLPNLNEKVVALTDLNGDFRMESWTEDGQCQPHVLNGESIVLQEMVHSAGGKTQFLYSNEFMFPVVKRILRDPLKESLPTTTTFQYFKPIRDPLTHMFAGFQFVLKTMSALEKGATNAMASAAGSEILSQYSIDKSYQPIEGQRMPLVGIPLLTLQCDLNACQEILEAIQASNEIPNRWLMYEKQKYQFIKDLRGYENPLENQFYVILSESHKELSRQSGSNTSLTTQQQIFEFSNLGIVRTEIKEMGLGLEAVGPTPDIYRDAFAKTTLEYANYRGRLVASKRQRVNQATFRNHLLEEDVTYLYEGDPGQSNYTVTEKHGETIQSARVFSPSGQLVSETNISGGQISYDQSGLRQTKTNAMGLSETTRTDLFGRVHEYHRAGKDLLPLAVIATRDVDGHVISYSVNERHYQNSLQTTDYGFERIDSFDGKELSRSYYNGFAQPFSTWEKLSTSQWQQSLGHWIDASGRVIASTLPRLAPDPTADLGPLEVNYQLDALGRPTWERDGRGQIHLYHYDSGCKSHYIEKETFRPFEKICRNISGQLKSYQKPEQRSTDVTQEESGKVSAVDYYRYDRDLVGRVLESTEHGRLEKSRSFSPSQRMITYNDGFQEFLDAFGQIEKTMEGRTLRSSQIKDPSGKTIDYRLAMGNTQQTIQYNDYDQAQKVTTVSFAKTFTQSMSYLSDGRLDTVRNEGGSTKSTEKWSWDERLLTSVSPWIERIEYDDYGFMQSIKYPHLKVEFENSRFKDLLSLTVRAAENKKYTETLRVDTNGLVVHKSTSLGGYRQARAGSYFYDEHHELKATTTSNKGGIQSSRHLTFANVESFPGVEISKGHAFGVGEYAIYSVSSNEIRGVFSTKSPAYKELYIDDNLHQINGHFVKYYRLQGRFVGVLISGSKVNGFFPIVADHLNSVRMIFDSEGQVLASRLYDPWGILISEEYGSDQGHLVSDLIRYDFAGLKRPLGSDYLLAKARVYSPQAARWVTRDPVMLWSPELFANKSPAELDGFSYAKNNPLRYTDPSGHMAGDVWLYRSDGSFQSSFANAMSKFFDRGKNGPYSHASIEINHGAQFTANGSGSHLLVSSTDVLFNRNGNGARVIDVYRHRMAEKFDAKTATYQAAKTNFVKNGMFLLKGWCSERTVEGIRAGGLTTGNYGWFTTPNDIYRDSNFEHVGIYDTEYQMSSEVRR
jgi:RHS repeat-associated protein